jgi:hypothetical protein
MSALKSIISRQKVTLKKVKDAVDQLYARWDGGVLKREIEDIKMLKEAAKTDYGWDPSHIAQAGDIQAKISKVREMTASMLRSAKERTGNQKPFVVHIMELDFPPGDTPELQLDWCRYAKMAAFAMERFHSHAARKNPRPKKWDKLTEEEKERLHKDRRPVRTEEEQKWLNEQDKLSRIQKKLRYYERKLRDMDEGRMTEEEKKKWSTRKRRSKKQDRQGGEGESSAPPMRPRRQHPPRRPPAHVPTVAPGGSRIVPYEERQLAPRRAAALSQRLPAFPAFPASRRY